MKKWIQTLSNKDRESFLEFCKKTVSPVQIYLFSRFLGFQGTIVECNEWSEKEFKKALSIVENKNKSKILLYFA